MNDLVVSSDRQFSRALFGLNKSEVYSYLNEIGGAYEELQLQTQVLREQNDKLSDSNRDNALKLYNLQADLTDAQKKTDKVNVELDAAKKQIAALQKELEDAKKEAKDAEKRIKTLTDELIKAGVSASTEPEKASVSETSVSEESVTEPSGEAQTVQSKEPEKPAYKDIFADMRKDVAAEKAQASSAPDTSTTSSANNFDDDEVYAGEVEVEVDESMLIGNDDDADEGFNFL